MRREKGDAGERQDPNSFHKAFTRNMVRNRVLSTAAGIKLKQERAGTSPPKSEEKRR